LKLSPKQLLVHRGAHLLKLGLVALLQRGQALLQRAAHLAQTALIGL